MGTRLSDPFGRPAQSAGDAPTARPLGDERSELATAGVVYCFCRPNTISPIIRMADSEASTSVQSKLFTFFSWPIFSQRRYRTSCLSNVLERWRSSSQSSLMPVGRPPEANFASQDCYKRKRFSWGSFSNPKIACRLSLVEWPCSWLCIGSTLCYTPGTRQL